MSFYFQAKSELNTCVGMGEQIPWTAIRDYAETYGLNVDQLDDLTRKIRAMEEGAREAQRIEKERKETANADEKTDQKKG